MLLADVNCLTRKSVLNSVDVDLIVMQYEQFQIGFNRVAPNKYTFKMHFMQHYRLSTQRHGNLAALTTYGMESDIGWLEQYSFNAKRPLEKQIVRIITMREMATCPVMRRDHGIVTEDPDLLDLISRLAGDRADATRSSNGDYIQWDTTGSSSAQPPRPFARTTSPPGLNYLCLGNEPVDADMTTDCGLWVLPKPAMQALLAHVRSNLPHVAQQCPQPALWRAVGRNVSVRRYSECRVGSWVVTSKLKATKKQNDPSCVGAVIRYSDIVAAEGTCSNSDNGVRFGSVQYFFSLSVPIVFAQGHDAVICEMLLCEVAWRRPFDVGSWCGCRATVYRDAFSEDEGYPRIVPVSRLVRSVAFVPDARLACDQVVMLPEF